jgi:hypothetical protein
VFINNLWSHGARQAMTDETLLQINQTSSKSVDGFKRYEVKSLAELLPPMALIKLTEPSAPIMRVNLVVFSWSHAFYGLLFDLCHAMMRPPAILKCVSR